MPDKLIYFKKAIKGKFKTMVIINYLRFLHEDNDKVRKQTRDKHGGLNPCYFVI